MEVNEMQSGLFKYGARPAMLVALALALGMLAFALLSAGTRVAQAAPHHATHHATHHARHHASTNDPTTTTDPDNVQSGDQTTPDAPGTTSSETSSESESSVDSEQGQPGEPANGHQDTGANAVNECTGNCVQ
jgi:hypothetical protein